MSDFVRPSSQITLFLDSFICSTETLAPLNVEIKEIDVKSRHDDNNVIVVRIDQVGFHMNKRQLDFIASALATASACSPGSINISRKLDQSRPVVDDPMERVADKLLAGSSFTVEDEDDDDGNDDWMRFHTDVALPSPRTDIH